MSIVRPANVSSPNYNPGHLARASASKRLENLIRKSQPIIAIDGFDVDPQKLIVAVEDAKIKHLANYAASLSPGDLVFNAYRIANVMRASR